MASVSPPPPSPLVPSLGAEAGAGAEPPSPAKEGVGSVALPPHFLEWCARQGLDASLYTGVEVTTFPRFIYVPLAARQELCAQAATAGHDAVASDDGTPGPDALLAPLRAEYGASVQRVAWLPAGFYFMDGSVGLAGTRAYERGLVHGIDASSAAAVEALGVTPGARMLEICCAPGAKMCYAADRMRRTGSITGVDISRDRLMAAATLLRKYDVVAGERLQRGWRVRLVAADGTSADLSPPPLPTYDLPPDAAPATSAAHPSEAVHCDGGGGGGGGGSGGKRRRALEGDDAAGGVSAFVRAETTAFFRAPRPTPAAHAAREEEGDAAEAGVVLDSVYENLFRPRGAHLRGLPPPPSALHRAIVRRLMRGAAHAPHEAGDGPAARCFTHVLVDAHCSHDGSLRHVAKFATQWGWDTLAARMHDTMDADLLRDCQRGLLANGFRHLEVGGVLIYSTCSLTRAQNEDVVSWLLATAPQARLAPLPWPPRTHAPPPRPQLDADGGVAGTARGSALAALFASYHCAPAPPAVEGGLPGTLRFDPLLSGCSGLFIAHITKLPA